MPAYLLGRLASLILSLIAASIVIFLVLEVVPGDPAQFMLGLNAQPDTVAALRAQMGLDQPLLVRYIAWIAGMLHGDLGTSYTYRVPVIELVNARLVVSLPLAIYAAYFAFLSPAFLLIWFGVSTLAILQRSTHCGLPRQLTTAFLLPLLWTLQAAFLLVGVPAATLYVSLMILSFL